MSPISLSTIHFLLYTERTISLYRVRGRRIISCSDYHLGDNDNPKSLLAQIRDEHSLRSGQPLIAGLSLRYFNLIQFQLPLAAEANLDEAVGYELVRHVPYDLEQCRYDYSIERQDDQLNIQVILILQSAMHTPMAELSAAGMSVSAVAPALFLTAWMNQQPGVYLDHADQSFEVLVYRGGHVVLSSAGDYGDSGELALTLVQNHRQENEPIWVPKHSEDVDNLLGGLSDQAQSVNLQSGSQIPLFKSLSLRLDLVSTKDRRRRRWRLRLLAASLACLVLSLFGYPLASLMGQQKALRQLDAQLAVVRERAEQMDGLRQQNQDIIERFEGLAEHLRGQPQAVDVLKEITDILISETWLDSLEIHDRNVTLRGTSATATSVIESLSESPLFEDVHFDSPVVKKGNRETFTIVAAIR